MRNAAGGADSQLLYSGQTGHRHSALRQIAAHARRRFRSDLALVVQTDAGRGMCRVLAVEPAADGNAIGTEDCPMGEALRELGRGPRRRIVYMDLSTARGVLLKKLHSMGLRHAICAHSDTGDGAGVALCLACKTTPGPIDHGDFMAMARRAAAVVRSGGGRDELPGEQYRADEASAHTDAVAHLARTVSHDLNNALAAIVGHCQLLLAEVAGAEQHRRIERILHRATQLMAMARALEELASEHIPPPRQQVDLGELARNAVGVTRCVWRDEAQRRGKRIHVGLEQAGPTVIVAEPTHLSRALLYVMMNAVEAVQEKGNGRIVVRVRAEGAYAVCEIEDDGPGMSEDVLQRAKNPFFTTRPNERRGLGLSLADAIVRQHGGDLEIESAPGEGTVVRLVIPLAQGAEIEAADAPA